MAGDDLDLAVTVAVKLLPKALPELVAPAADRPGMLLALLEHPRSIYQDVDFGPIMAAEFQRLVLLPLVTEEQQQLLKSILFRISYDSRGPVGRAAWLAMNQLQVEFRVHLFAEAAMFPPFEPDKDYARIHPYWTPWQSATDALLPWMLVGDLVEAMEDPSATKLIAAGSRCSGPNHEPVTEAILFPTTTQDEIRSWALGRLALVAPITVARTAAYFVRSPTWLWTLRAVVSVGHRMPPISGWKSILVKMVDKRYLASARMLLRCLFFESSRAKSRHGEYESILEGMLKKYPIVLEYAKEAGFFV